MGQADRELSGAGAVRVVQRGSAVATYHETGQLIAAFPAGGSCPSHGPRAALETFYVSIHLSVPET